MPRKVTKPFFILLSSLTFIVLLVRGVCFFSRPLACEQIKPAHPEESGAQFVAHRCGEVIGNASTGMIPGAVISGSNVFAADERPTAWRLLQPGDVFEIQIGASETISCRVLRRGVVRGSDFLTAEVPHVEPPMAISMTWSGDSLSGQVLDPARNRAFLLSANGKGPLAVDEKLLSQVLCVRAKNEILGTGAGEPVAAGLPRPTNETTSTDYELKPSGGAVPMLQSRTSATSVIYLDFDGETVTDPAWAGGATIVGPAARLNESQINEVWQRVAQDFSAYHVNVTTVLADYNNAPVNKRAHCVITQNDAAAPGTGGVAYIGSFNGSSSWICWAFLDTNAKNCAEVISHEIGHTLGLFHDGRISPPEEYYAGHGSGLTGWAPIMGVGYYKELVQWSKGEYADASNSEDDLSVMTNHIHFRTDDFGGTTGTASAIVGDSVAGNIERTTDLDMFSISLTAGAHTVYLQTESHGNLDAQLRVFSVNGSLIASSNPPFELTATANFSLATQQTVYLEVNGIGKDPVAGDGYSDYGSLGKYLLFGFGDQQQPPSAPVGLTFRRVSGSRLELSWQAGLGVASYSVYRDGGYLVTTSGTMLVNAGLIPGSTYSYRVSASNAYGASPLSEPGVITMPDADEFIMDGEADFTRYLLSNPGMVIYACVRSNRLYVSTWSPGSFGTGFGNDHHIFISDVLLPAATTAAPWAKRGQLAIPSNKPYLAGEESSGYAGWFNTTGEADLFKGPVNSLQLEGSFDMLSTFGYVPSTVYIAAVAYQTGDAGVDPNLGRVTAQAPSAVIANDDIEPGEFLAVPLDQVRDSTLDGTFDILSPELDFFIRTLVPATTGTMKFDWLTTPGAQFSVYRQTNGLVGPWQFLSTRVATAGQWQMSFSDNNQSATSVFYQIHLKE